MASVKFSDIVKSYVDYNTSGEFTVWVEKLELVAQLQDITDKLKFIPLFLAGPAFAVYQQLSDDNKKDYEKVKPQLTTAFSTNSFAAYEQFRNRVLTEGESVDVYLADLRRLAQLIGQRDANVFIRCAFVAGLPPEISRQLRSMANLDKMELSDIVAKARGMLATSSSNDSYACAGVNNFQNNRRAKQCFKCQGYGHWSRECPTKHVYDGQKIRRCYICNSPEHLANKCSQRSGNGVGVAPASGAHPEGL